MKKTFGARRVPRKIGGDDDEARQPGDSTSEHTAAVVKRPGNSSRKSFPVRSSLGFQHDEGEDQGSSVVTPKANASAKSAVQRSSGATAIASFQDRDLTQERPSYSKSYLEELKQSTPQAPKEPGSSSRAIDVASKFGSDLTRYDLPTAIPTEAEIKEKKARRARIAPEQDFISLEEPGTADPSNGPHADSDDDVTHDDSGRLILRPEEKHPETRLVRDDEDMYEGFDDFTATEASGSRLHMTNDPSTQAARQRREEISAMIASAEHENDDSGDGENDAEGLASDVERNAIFESTQARKGAYTSTTAPHAPRDHNHDRPRTPPRIAPLPTLNGVLTRLRDRMEKLQLSRQATEKELQAFAREKVEIAQDEVRVQNSLAETAERYRRLKEEALGRMTEEQRAAAGQGHEGQVVGTADRSRDGDGDGVGDGIVTGVSTGTGLGMPSFPGSQDHTRYGAAGMGLGASRRQEDSDGDD